MLSADDKAIRLKQIYSELDRKYEEEQAQRTAESFGLPYINLYGFPVDHAALAIVPKEEAERLKVATFYKEGRNIKLGALEPSDEINKFLGQLKEQSYYVELFIISQSSFNKALSMYDRLVSGKRKSQEILLISKSFQQSGATLKDMGEKLTNASPTEVIEMLLGNALHLDASDIHVEPTAKDMHVRFRIDGVLQDVTVLSRELQHQLVSRIKVLSKLKLNVTTTPQDGSFSLTYDGQQVDVRVSVLPSAFGESVVMRILRQDKGALQFEELGIKGLAYDQLLKEMEKPNGMILTTGPTGSGKTTTLYAILNKLNEPGVKIITLEDPVEYKIEGITQTPIDANAGMTFASGLRAILRQDPDIILVGEMRDLETAETAAQAALTGHIVLSTLHTNDAPAAIPRLLDLGIKPFVLAPAINAVIAQRLIRKICSQCKTTYTLPENLRARVELILQGLSKASKVEVPKKLEFFHSPGCPACKGLGYKGRLGVYEVFTITDAIEKLIRRSATTTEIRKQAIEEGMLTMAQDGVLKALAGLTDVEEVFRVTEE